MSRRAGQLVKRGDRKWLARVYVGTANGRKVYRSNTVRGTKKDAERVLNELLRAVDSGMLKPQAEATFGEYLDEWLRVKRSKLEPRTVEGYERLLDTHVRPALGARRLDSIKPGDVEALYARVLEAAGAHAQASTHRVLHSALADAVRSERNGRNPATGRTVARVPNRKFVTLNAEQTRALIAELDTHPLGIVFTLSLVTGMRPGEVQALRWESVDLEIGVVTVDRAVKELRGGRYEFGDPKTHRARRVPIDPETVARLRAHRAAQAGQRLRLGSAWAEQGLVFATQTGGILARQNLSARVLKPALARAELPAPFRWYDCRHTCATLLLAAGVSPKVVAERLGHASAAFTLERYAHVAPGMQEVATERLGAMLFGDRSPGLGAR